MLLRAVPTTCTSRSFGRENRSSTGRSRCGIETGIPCPQFSTGKCCRGLSPRSAQAALSDGGTDAAVRSAVGSEYQCYFPAGELARSRVVSSLSCWLVVHPISFLASMLACHMLILSRELVYRMRLAVTRNVSHKRSSRMSHTNKHAYNERVPLPTGRGESTPFATSKGKSPRKRPKNVARRKRHKRLNKQLQKNNLPPRKPCPCWTISSSRPWGPSWPGRSCPRPPSSACTGSFPVRFLRISPS